MFVGGFESVYEQEGAFAVCRSNDLFLKQNPGELYILIADDSAIDECIGAGSQRVVALYIGIFIITGFDGSFHKTVVSHGMFHLLTGGCDGFEVVVQESLIILYGGVGFLGQVVGTCIINTVRNG